jgi:predicted O-linked N-acetylglucosamine transferase (SPINDLY family)
MELERQFSGHEQAEAATGDLERLIQLARLAPEDLQTSLLLAEALSQAGRQVEALEVCRKVKAAKRVAPIRAAGGLEAEFLAVSAWIFLGLGMSRGAESLFRRALVINSGLMTAHLGLATILFGIRREEEAEAHFAQAASLAPADPAPLIGLTATCAALGRSDEAVVYGSAAVALAPGNFEARLVRCMANLRIIYDRPEQIEESRRAYLEALEELSSSIRLNNPADVKAAAGALGGVKPFYLAYQGLCDAELQSKYGDLATRISAAAWPEHARPLAPQPVDGPLRIGIVSAYFYNHSNWKMHIRDWVENLAPDRFEVFGYYLNSTRDQITDQARRSCHRFVDKLRSVEEFASCIRGDRLHALIYPEIGMHPATFKLATMRLAPVQCNSWGHPETSGLPTMDYFLSSDLMEPVGAEAHYTERLVRLPNLSTHYIPPDVPFAYGNRDAFGLPENEILYFCAQSLYKYLPQYDDIFPRIALEVPNCRFVFMASQGSPRITEQFAARLRRAFSRHGLNLDRHMILVKRLPPASYHALNLCCDVFLDSVGWSGCNTTLEAMACGLPVVTLPNGLMRGRHTLAFLSMMGETRTVAGSVDEYVAMAVRLGRDREWRDEMKTRVVASRGKAYSDLECVRALETFLTTVATA